jgi:hypothetical protein
MMVLTYQITQHQYKHGIEIVIKLIWVVVLPQMIAN